MNYRLSALSMGIFAALCFSAGASAQDAAGSAAAGQNPAQPQASSQQAAADQKQAKQLAAVTVTGIRASLQKSLDLKRNSDSIIDAISAEDVGKFPDTNVAESLSHLPGISVDRTLGEGDKVSILGTDPALNRLLLNGQTLASTNWTSDPTNPDGRSFNYSLLASEIIGNAEVYKTPQAKIDEGSIGGTVIINTRRPLDLKANTLTGTVGYNYNDRADKGKPNASLFYSWKNSDGTFGALGSLMHEDKIIYREGTEVFGYQNVNQGGFNPGVVPPANANGLVPTSVNTALFQQERKRDGASGAIQWKPNENFELNLDGLFVVERFNNFNQSHYGYWGGNPQDATSLGFDSNNVATSGTYGPGAPTYLDGYERFSRVKTGTIHLRTDYHGDGWNASTQLGYTSSTGGSQGIYNVQYLSQGGYSWNVAGPHPTINYNTDQTNPNNLAINGAGYSRAPSYDKERYFQADFNHDLNFGPLNEIEVGIKATNHYNGQTNYASHIPSPVGSGTTLAGAAGGLTPGGYLDGLSPAGNMADWVQVNPGALKQYVEGLDPVVAVDPTATYAIQEQNRAFYIQGDFSGDNYRGNFGARYIHTRDGVTGFQSVGTNPATGQNNFAPIDQKNTYHYWLPSFNIAYDVRDDLTLRFSASKNIARPRFTDMTPYVALSDNSLTGSAGNVDLKPYRSTNFDASAEWYFQENSMLSAELFFRRISDYILSIPVQGQYFDYTTGLPAIYTIEKPVNAGTAKVKGISLTYQQQFGLGFGLLANYTYTVADTHNNITVPGVTGSFPLPYNSKKAFNLTPYYEHGPWSARVTYSWRSPYFTQIGSAASEQSTDIYRELDASISYQINEHFNVSFDATNLLDESYYAFNNTPAYPLNTYKNGRTYSLNFGFKL